VSEWNPFIRTSARAGVIRWEILTPASSSAAHLHLVLLSGCVGTVATKVQALLEAMHNAYHGVCALSGCKWPRTQDGGNSVRWIRSTWILHGREMINNAAERDWEGCVPLIEGPGVWSKCLIRRRMAQVGAWYLDVGILGGLYRGLG